MMFAFSLSPLSAMHLIESLSFLSCLYFSAFEEVIFHCALLTWQKKDLWPCRQKCCTENLLAAAVVTAEGKTGSSMRPQDYLRLQVGRATQLHLPPLLFLLLAHHSPLLHTSTLQKGLHLTGYLSHQEVLGWLCLKAWVNGSSLCT